MNQQEAAAELLKRREARKGIKAFARYMLPSLLPPDVKQEPADHHNLLLDVMQDLFDGVYDRVMVFMPPGCAKSTYCSLIGPAFYLGVNPDHKCISASYDSDLASDFAGQVRNIFSQNASYAALFPNRALSADTKAKGNWKIDGHMGGYFAAGVGGAVTGRRGNLVILDDLVKSREQADSARVMENTWNWYTAALSTRMLPGAKYFYVTTRWSQNDPAGRLLPEEWDGECGIVRCTDGYDWYVLSLPAEAIHDDPLGRKPGEWLWPDYYTPDWWEKTKKFQIQSGVRNWDSLFQQNPTPDEGTYFKRDWFNFYTPETQPKTYTPYVSGDFAVSEGRGDWTEIGVFGVDKDDNIYVAPDSGWYSGQVTADRWIEELLDFVDYFKPQAFISEKGVIRNSIEPFLNKRMADRKTYVMPEWLSHIGNKEANARAFQARAALGKIYLPEGEIGERILKQLIEFPAGKHDDIVDVCGLMGRYLNETVVPNTEKESVIVLDRWDKAFQRQDMESENTWRTA